MPQVIFGGLSISTLDMDIAHMIDMAPLAYLSYRGWVDVRWAAVEDASEQVIHALNNTATQFAAHPSTVAASGLPIAATFGFVPGLLMGFKKG